MISLKSLAVTPSFCSLLLMYNLPLSVLNEAIRLLASMGLSKYQVNLL